MKQANDFRASDGTPAPFVPSRQFRRYDKIKRAIDFVAALFLLLLCAIPGCLIAVIITATSRGSAVFRQTRIGRGGRPFECYKFRTMYENAPRNRATRDFGDAKQYITPFGDLLRKTSLDELPQILNILKGEMSFIGPRPLIPEEADIHEDRMRRGVYALRPGLSGLAQVNGRDRVSAKEKVDYDEQYLRGYSLRQDTGIFISTILGVLKGSDIVEGEQTES